MLRIILLLSVILAASPVFAQAVNPDGGTPGITIFTPTHGEEMPAQFILRGKVWDKEGIAKVVVYASADNGSFMRQFEGAVDKVIYKGEVLHILGAYSAKIELPEGSYTIWAETTGYSGKTAKTAERKVTVNPAILKKGFEHFSLRHGLGVLLTLLMIAGMIVMLKRMKSPTAELRAEWILAAILWTNEIVLNIFYISIDAYRIGQHLPFHLCGVSVVLIPFMFFTKNEKLKKFLFEVVYFWGLGGATQALLTPDIPPFDFPHFKFFTFFISHGAIIASAAYMAFVKGFKPTLASVGRILLFTNAMVLLMFGVNYAVRFLPPYEAGNYFFLSYPPVDGSLIDVMVDIFGPAPRYLIGLEILGIAIFLALYLPFGIGAIVRRINPRREKEAKNY
ncbi:MAG: hypothetical protein A2Y33_16765 [Spirochaetes bacterium GWF1_51_8]|nr:MAG: hypothetical protein A2Y33_16765 [Spirochaetes bacterium GWF1_51_8]